uniref:hypothetical protein n=1 Tax=Stappia sp. TaxID=1870903 RepID=UPI003BA9A11A
MRNIGSAHNRGRIVFVLLAGLFLAACQTAGLKPGALTTTFPPKGWSSQKVGSVTTYECPKATCGQRQTVLVKPGKVHGDVESAIRRGKLNTELLASFLKFVHVATDKKVSFSATRRITTPTYSGFQFVVTTRNRRGKRFYMATRIVTQNNRGVQVQSFAHSRALAVRNLERYFANTRIRRVN